MKPVTIQKVHAVLRKAHITRSSGWGYSGYWAGKDHFWPSDKPQIRVGYATSFAAEKQEKLAKCQTALETAGLTVKHHGEYLLVTSPEEGEAS